MTPLRVTNHSSIVLVTNIGRQRWHVGPQVGVWAKVVFRHFIRRELLYRAGVWKKCHDSLKCYIQYNEIVPIIQASYAVRLECDGCDVRTERGGSAMHWGTLANDINPKRLQKFLCYFLVAQRLANLGGARGQLVVSFKPSGLDALFFWRLIKFSSGLVGL